MELDIIAREIGSQWGFFHKQGFSAKENTLRSFETFPGRAKINFEKEVSRTDFDVEIMEKNYLWMARWLSLLRLILRPDCVFCRAAQSFLIKHRLDPESSRFFPLSEINCIELSLKFFAANHFTAIRSSSQLIIEIALVQIWCAPFVHEINYHHMSALGKFNWKFSTLDWVCKNASKFLCEDSSQVPIAFVIFSVTLIALKGSKCFVLCLTTEKFFSGKRFGTLILMLPGTWWIKTLVLCQLRGFQWFELLISFSDFSFS